MNNLIIQPSAAGQGGRPKIEKTTEELLNAIEGCRGRVKIVAQKLGVDRRTAERLIDENIEAKEEYESQWREFGDDILEVVDELAMQGDSTIIKHLLNSKRFEYLQLSQGSTNVKIDSTVNVEGQIKTTNADGILNVLSEDKINAIHDILTSKE